MSSPNGGITENRQNINRSVFQIGDTVRSLADGRVGTIVFPTGAQQVATLANPATNKVDVKWADGTQSVVSLDTLGKVV